MGRNLTAAGTRASEQGAALPPAAVAALSYVPQRRVMGSGGGATAGTGPPLPVMVAVLSPSGGAAALATLLALEGLAADSGAYEVVVVAPAFKPPGPDKRTGKAPPPALAASPYPPGVTVVPIDPSAAAAAAAAVATSGPALFGGPTGNDGGLAKALQYFRSKRSQYHCLVLVSEAALVGVGVVSRLVRHATKPTAYWGAVAPLTTHEATRHNAQRLETHYALEGGGGDAAFARHPLSFARVAAAVGAAADAASAAARNPAEASPLRHVGCVAGAVLALSQSAADAMGRAVGSHDAKHSGMCDLLSKAGVDLAVHVGTFAYAAPRPGQAAPALPAPPSSPPPSPPPGRHGGPRNRALVVVTCSSVRRKTVQALVSLEATRDAFDLLVAVSPFPGDDSAAYAAAAGLSVLLQPEPLGLTDLWNRAFAYAVAHGYEALVLSNNDVLVPDGAVDGLVAGLAWGGSPSQPVPVVSAVSNAAGGMDYAAWSGEVPAAAHALHEHPLAYVRTAEALGAALPNDLQLAPVDGFTAYFWAIGREAATAVAFPDGSLFDADAHMNFGQEKDLVDRLRKAELGRPHAVLSSFVHHYRGATLAPCKNGQFDCAYWQKGHRQDESRELDRPIKEATAKSWLEGGLRGGDGREEVAWWVREN